jgi:hypothetical protein
VTGPGTDVARVGDWFDPELKRYLHIVGMRAGTTTSAGLFPGRPWMPMGPVELCVQLDMVILPPSTPPETNRELLDHVVDIYDRACAAIMRSNWRHEQFPVLMIDGYTYGPFGDLRTQASIRMVLVKA